MTKRPGQVLIYILLIIIPLAVYWQAIGFDFVWDDRNPNLIENQYLQNPTLENVLHFWVKPYAQMYIPMSYTGWALVKQIGHIIPFGEPEDGFNPFAFHLCNILFHILNGLLIFNILKLLINKNLPSFIGALFFLLHPLQVESVVWITEFRGLLAAFFGLSSLFVLLKSELGEDMTSSRKCKLISYINSLILFLFGLLSKPSVAVIPIFAFFIFLLYFKRSLWYSIKKIIPFVVITIPFIFILRTVQPSSFHTEVAPLWSRFFIWMDTINFYLTKTVFPYPLIATYSRTFHDLISHFWFYIEWIVPPILIIFALRSYKKSSYLLLSLFIFIAGFLPVSGLVPFVFQKWSNVADRYVYLSLLGVGLIISWLLKKYHKKILWAFIIVILVCLTILTSFVQIPIWKNSLVLWTHALTYGEPNTYAFNNRGIAYQKIGEYELALEDFKKSIILNSLHTKSYYNIGIVYAENEKPDSAITYFDKAITQKTDYIDAYLNRGVAYNNLGQYEKALQDFGRVITINPKDEMAYSNRGLVYLELKQYNDALKDFSRAIMLNPNRAQTYYLRGKTKLLLGDKESALKDFTTALNLKPGMIDTLIKRALLYEEIGNLTAAYLDAESAYHLDAENNETAILFGDLLVKKGEYSSALDVYTNAISHHPAKGHLYQKRAVVYYLLKQYRKSKEGIDKAEALGAIIPESFKNALMEKLQ